MFVIGAVYLNVKVADMSQNPAYHPNVTAPFILKNIGFYLTATALSPRELGHTAQGQSDCRRTRRRRSPASQPARALRSAVLRSDTDPRCRHCGPYRVCSVHLLFRTRYDPGRNPFERPVISRRHDHAEKHGNCNRSGLVSLYRDVVRLGPHGAPDGRQRVFRVMILDPAPGGDR